MNFHEIHSFLPLPRWLNEAYLQNMMTAPSQEKVMEFKETFTLLSQARCPCRPCRSCRAGFVLTCLLHSLAPPSRGQPAHTFSWPFTYLFRQDLAAPPSDVSMMPLSQQKSRKYGRVWYNALTCAPSQTHVCCVPVGLLMFVVLLARWPGAFSLSLRGAHPPPRWRGGLRPLRRAGSWTAKGRAATSKCQGADAHDTLRWGRWGHRYGSWAGC